MPRQDHLPVSLCVELRAASATSLCKRRVAGYERSAVKDMAANAKFGLLLDRIPSVNYSVEPTAHLHLATKCVQVAARLAFPLQKALPRKPGMSAESVKLV